MKKNKFTITVFLVMSLFLTIKADVAPEPGEMRVGVPLVFTPDEDFSDYRFFLVSPIDIEEVVVKKDVTSHIDESGRGGAKKFVTLIAIPKKELAGFSAKLSVEENKKLFTDFQEKKFKEVSVLIKHGFSKDISIKERANWAYKTYKIQRAENSLKAVETQAVSPKISLEEERLMSGNFFGLMTVVAGILLALAAVLAFLAIRRRR